MRGEIKINIQCLCNLFVTSKLRSIIRSNGMNTLFIGKQLAYSGLFNTLAVLAFSSFSIRRNPVVLSTIVSMAPRPSFPMMVSISQSPNLPFSSTILGRCSIPARSFILVLLPVSYTHLQTKSAVKSHSHIK